MCTARAQHPTSVHLPPPGARDRLERFHITGPIVLSRCCFSLFFIISLFSSSHPTTSLSSYFFLLFRIFYNQNTKRKLLKIGNEKRCFHQTSGREDEKKQNNWWIDFCLVLDECTIRCSWTLRSSAASLRLIISPFWLALNGPVRHDRDSTVHYTSSEIKGDWKSIAFIICWEEKKEKYCWKEGIYYTRLTFVSRLSCANRRTSKGHGREKSMK